MENLIGKRIERIAFVSPPLSLEERHGDFEGAGSSMPSLGLLMLGAVVRRVGCEPFAIEAAENMSLRQVMDEVTEIRPDMVGIPATDSLDSSIVRTVLTRSSRRGRATRARVAQRVVAAGRCYLMLSEVLPGSRNAKYLLPR
jgi:hypothetical protein